jgi:hypothetical protein
MPVPFNKFDSFAEAVAEKQHDLGSDQLEIALSATAPSAANTQLSDITQISYTNLSARTLTRSSSAQTGGLYRLIINDLTLTATGPVATFRYIIVFNQTSTNDLLIGWYDYGTNIALNGGETFTVDFDGVNGILTIA